MKKEIEAIRSAIVDSVETEFHVDITTDSGGAHFSIYLPKNTCITTLREKLSILTLSKRYVILLVPDGYIETFLRHSQSV